MCQILGVARTENPAGPSRGPLLGNRKPEILAFVWGRNDKIGDLRTLKHMAGLPSRNSQNSKASQKNKATSGKQSRIFCILLALRSPRSTGGWSAGQGVSSHLKRGPHPGNGSKPERDPIQSQVWVRCCPSSNLPTQWKRGLTPGGRYYIETP